MGFHKVIYLYCDGGTANCECGGSEALWGDVMAQTIAEYKATAKADGWHFKGRKAYCPSCWKALKEAEIK